LSERASEWRSDVDALTFEVGSHTGRCFVQRGAFGTLLGHDPVPAECAQYFEEHRAVFERAAQEKLLRAKIAAGANYHLTSRDIARELTYPAVALGAHQHATDPTESLLDLSQRPLVRE